MDSGRIMERKSVKWDILDGFLGGALFDGIVFVWTSCLVPLKINLNVFGASKNNLKVFVVQNNFERFLWFKK